MTIRNSGEIEMEALTLLGVSSKEGDNSKIGFFGSGNKYAIATLLRNSIPFEIYTGLRKVEITTEEVNFRGETFHRVLVDGIHTSLTTRMGPQWEPWYAIREFICNAMDEGGYELNPTDSEPREGTTLIRVEEVGALSSFLENIGDYILNPEAEGIKVTEDITVIPGEFNLFRKGIRVKPDGMNYSAIGAYNLNDISINESRIIQNLWELFSKVGTGIVETTNKEYATRVLNAFKDEKAFESVCYYYGTPSDLWHELLLPHTCAPYSAKKVIPMEDLYHYIFLPNSFCEKLAEAFPDLRIWGEQNEVGWEEDIEADKEPFFKGIKQLQDISLIDEYPVFRLGSFKDDSVEACYVKKLDEVWINKDTTYSLLPLLYEEYCHSKGYSDGSREFESFLIKELINAKGLSS